MRTVRRLYFYAVSLVSLEVVLWGLIGLVRSMFCPANRVCGLSNILAQGLALTLVGVPVFGFHWWWAQRASSRDMEEHASGVRAVFLYGALLGTLIPAVQNLLALVNRPVLSRLGLDATRAFVGGRQLWTDNVIAILLNLLVAFYFYSVLRADWRSIQPRETFADVRRVYRTIWVLYGLGLTVSGVQQLLHFIFFSDLNWLSSSAFYYQAVNGMVVTLVGTPIWVYAWLTAQNALVEPAERESLLRLALLYFLALAGISTVLTSGGMVLDVLLRLAFGLRLTFSEFLARISGPVSILVPLAGVWAYYGRWLGRAMAETRDVSRRSAMRRLYSYILSIFGLGATFTGLALLLSFVVDAAIGRLVWADTLAPRLAASLATLFVGLPLWLLAWRPMQAEALSTDDDGDHARRSVLRKIFLYVVMFVSVVGGMFTAFNLLNLVLRALFGGSAVNLLQGTLKSIEVLALFVGMGIYHGRTLAKDGKIAAGALARRHASFPVLVFDPGDGVFGQDILAALQKQTPSLPAAVHSAGQAVRPEAAPKAVVMPLDLALDPPEWLRGWLGGFDGSRLVVPRTDGKWVYAGAVRPPAAAAGQAAQAIRQLAEGQEARIQGGTSAWMIVLYVLAALVGLPLIISLISMLTNTIFG
jgi:hypothetical protein